MNFIDKLEKRFGRYIPENITLILLVGQVLSYVLVYSSPRLFPFFLLSGESLLKGEIWRLATYLFGPVSESLLFVIFAWYFFYMLGTALESRWGSFRYLLFLAIAYIGNIIISLLFPFQVIRNSYLYTSLFLAFAHLYPNFQLLLFFIIPVKVKWLGYIAWFGLIASFIFGDISEKAVIFSSVLNFLLFFSSDLIYASRVITKGLFGKTGGKIHKGKPLHVCAACGKNELDNPDMDIRYCNSCFPDTCYCGEHIKSHQHKRAVN